MAVEGGRRIAVEAKFVKDWAKSIYNASSPVGAKAFAGRVRASLLSQAQKYAASGRFTETIYYSNSPEFIAQWSEEFARAGISGIRFVLRP